MIQISIASEIQRIKNNIAAAYSACERKGADLPQLQNSNNLEGTIDSIPQGSGTVEQKDINFYDYDGTRLYSFTFSEVASLSALPAIPSHHGLTTQGWNYTLSSIQSYASRSRKADVGATYITDNGHTRLYLHVENAEYLQPTITPVISGTLTLTIDWGDGTAPDVITQTNACNHTWNFSSYPADVVIDIAPSGSGSFFLDTMQDAGVFVNNAKGMAYVKMLRKVEFGTNVSSAILLGNKMLEAVVIPRNISSMTDGYIFRYCNSLAYVVIPDGVTSIGSFSFQYCSSLIGVSIPDSVTSIGNSVCNTCSSLEHIIIPDGVTSIGDEFLEGSTLVKSIILSKELTSISYNTCYGCGLLTEITIPDSVTSILYNAFIGCSSLTEITIPDSVTSIGASAFNGCSGLFSVDVSRFTDPSAVPSLANHNAFSSTPNNMVIYVADQAMLNAFTSATNWSYYASRFQIKGE